MGAYSLLCGLWLSISNSDQPDVLKGPPVVETGESFQLANRRWKGMRGLKHWYKIGVVLASRTAGNGNLKMDV